MTQGDETRTTKCVLAERRKWLLHRRRHTKKINIPGCRKKIGKKEKKNEKRKVESKAQKQARKSYSRRLHSNKSSRLCYEAETGTLSHRLPSSSCCRWQRYQVSLLPLSSPPRANKSTKTKQNCLDSAAVLVATQVPLISRTVTLPLKQESRILLYVPASTVVESPRRSTEAGVRSVMIF